VQIENRRFTATDIGKIVSRFLTQYFTTYVDYDFTAKMEDSLDAVASGEQEWVPLLEKFWKPFIDLVTHTETSVSREEVAQARDLGVDPVSGKPMSVRMGRFGPFVQIGTKDDVDKPRFAGLRPGQKMDQITHADALELFKLPRKLGTTATGEEITTNTGRFGPYVKYGAKYVSLKSDDPYTISPERALEVIREKEVADANRLIRDFPDDGIQVLNGRYGPYITDKARNAKIPKDRDPKVLTLDECKTLLAAAPARTVGKWGRKSVKAKAAATVTGKPAAVTGKPAVVTGKDPAPKRAPHKAAAEKGGAGAGKAPAGLAAGAVRDVRLATAAAKKNASVKVTATPTSKAGTTSKLKSAKASKLPLGAEPKQAKRKA
jgi:DNA topoisomerase-1